MKGIICQRHWSFCERAIPLLNSNQGFCYTKNNYSKFDKPNKTSKNKIISKSKSSHIFTYHIIYIFLLCLTIPLLYFILLILKTHHPKSDVSQKLGFSQLPQPPSPNAPNGLRCGFGILRPGVAVTFSVQDQDIHILTFQKPIGFLRGGRMDVGWEKWKKTWRMGSPFSKWFV